LATKPDLPVFGIIMLASVFDTYSKCWISLKIEIARRHNQPIVAVPAHRHTTVSLEVEGARRCCHSVGTHVRPLLQGDCSKRAIRRRNNAGERHVDPNNNYSRPTQQ